MAESTAIAATVDRESQSGPVAIEGRNCWRRGHADRVAFLIDGAAYFEAFAAAAERARHSILILAWDFNGAVTLEGGAAGPSSASRRVDEFLDQLAARRRGLHVYVLDWDYPLLYAWDRQAFPGYRFRWWTHRRFHFELDSNHPFGACHHQKVVVIDDAIAFVGGLDFAGGRWDTPDHCATQRRRLDAAGKPCGPYHDLMMAVDGAAARALGDLARDRWRRATGRRLKRPRRDSDPWPPSLQPDVRAVPVAISRTDPPSEDRPAVREVEALFIDAIAAARRHIYIENQYLTATCVGEALCARLQEPDGPEVVIVTTSVCGGWLEEGTMGVLRGRLVERLQRADRFDRLRIFCPAIPELCEQRYIVHAKVLVVDDVLARIGSANLNNRSMGLDTECDLTVEADGRADVRAGIARLRDRLLGEHLGFEPAEVAATLERSGSLIKTIDILRPGARSLEPLDFAVPTWLSGVMPEASIVDPDTPLASDVMVGRMTAIASDAVAARRARRWWVLLLAIALGVALWQVAPIRHWEIAHALGAVADWLNTSPLGFPAAVLVFTVASLAFVPPTVMIVGATLLHGFVWGAACAMVATMVSAFAGYALGRALGRDRVRRLIGARLSRISRQLARHGKAAIVTVRVLPVAPFTAVNMAAGLASIRPRDFALGTVVGLGPGIVLLSLFTHLVVRAAQRPTFANLIAAAAVTIGLTFAGFAVGRRLSRRTRN